MDPENADRLLWIMAGRHTCRSPFDRSWRITESQLAYILDAARWAPALEDEAAVRILVIDDPALLGRLERGVIAGAPLLVCVLVDPQRASGDSGEVPSSLGVGCLVQNMWLAAQSLHVDAEVLATATHEKLRRVLELPSPWRVACALRMGHAIPGSHARPSPLAHVAIDRNRVEVMPCGK